MSDENTTTIEAPAAAAEVELASGKAADEAKAKAAAEKKAAADAKKKAAEEKKAAAATAKAAKAAEAATKKAATTAAREAKAAEKAANARPKMPVLASEAACEKVMKATLAGYTAYQVARDKDRSETGMAEHREAYRTYKSAYSQNLAFRKARGAGRRPTAKKAKPAAK